jgi:hypothetical protein
MGSSANDCRTDDCGTDGGRPVPKPYPKRKPPLAFYALFQKKAAQRLAKVNFALSLSLGIRKK